MGCIQLDILEKSESPLRVVKCAASLEKWESRENLPTLKNRVNYYPFGMVMPGRSYTSESYRFGFNGHERDDEIAGSGNSLDFGARMFNPRLGRFFSADPWEKKYPFQTTYSYHGNRPASSIDWKGYGGEDCPDESQKDFAQLANHVYDGTGDIGEWEPSTAADGLTGFTREDPKSGFKSQLYERTVDGETEYVYVFAGTEDLTKDGWEDVLQAFGSSGQYHIATESARSLVDNLGVDNITFIGHSLGGGLAQAAAMKTSGTAVTFNPAWVSYGTMKAEGLSEEGASITNYVVQGDILNTLQPLAEGVVYSLLLKERGETRKMWSIESLYSSPVKQHLMEQVIEEFNDYFPEEDNSSNSEGRANGYPETYDDWQDGFGGAY